jgi:hypothetical protein
VIFIPREGEVDLFKPEEELITFDAKEMPLSGYEITSPSATDISQYRSMMEKLAPVLKSNEHGYVAVDWKKKKNCLVVVAESIEDKMKTLAESGIQASYEKIAYKLWEQSHQFITDRGEFEGIADLIVECVKDDDRFYVAYDWANKRNVFLWATGAAEDRARCMREKGFAAIVKT